jgi:hypothetical protein
MVFIHVMMMMHVTMFRGLRLRAVSAVIDGMREAYFMIVTMIHGMFACVAVVMIMGMIRCGIAAVLIHAVTAMIMVVMFIRFLGGFLRDCVHTESKNTGK